MVSSIELYKSIIAEEIQVFGVKESSLKLSAKSVRNTYSQNSLKNGNTYLDYNLPSNRCAYLYRFGVLHTDLVSSSFLRLINKKEIKSSFRKKISLRICCLGGGPGTDIVGLFKALAKIPYYHGRVVQVTVLDVCGGWRNSFKRIMTSLIEGKIKDVPASFVDASNFTSKLIEVNLLCELPPTVADIIAEADIVCMVKFVSAILGSPSSGCALEVIGKKLQIGAVVLFIDNANGSIFKPFFDISNSIGLHIVYGPAQKEYKRNAAATANEKKIFGCLPLNFAKATILGFIKSDSVYNNSVTLPLKDLVCNEFDDSSSWQTENGSENSAKETKRVPLEHVVKLCHDKFTQTNKIQSGKNSTDMANTGIPANQLCSLIDQLGSLIDVLSQWQQKFSAQKDCCHCH